MYACVCSGMVCVYTITYIRYGRKIFDIAYLWMLDELKKLFHSTHALPYMGMLSYNLSEVNIKEARIRYKDRIRES